MARIPPELRREWARRLADSGFSDIEDEHGRLKQPNNRTQAFQTRSITAEYYDLLAEYINTHQELSRLSRKILEMHSEGERLEDIAFEVYRSLAYVKSVIYKHRKELLHKK